MREIVLTAIARHESIIQSAFMPATLKRVRTIFIFNRGTDDKPIKHYPVVTPARNFAVNVARIIERVGLDGKPRQRYAEKRSLYLELLLTEFL